MCCCSAFINLGRGITLNDIYLGLIDIEKALYVCKVLLIWNDILPL